MHSFNPNIRPADALLLYYSRDVLFSVKARHEWVDPDLHPMTGLIDARTAAMFKVAAAFGKALDTDEFEATSRLLSPDCEYIIGDRVLTGREQICNSYKQNMEEGRKKLDRLEWGKSYVEAIGNKEFLVHFTDYLTHEGLDHSFRCKQKLSLGKNETD